MKVFILLIVILFSQTISAYPIIKPIGDNNDYLYVHLSALPIVDINISLKQGSISDGSKPGLTNLMLNTLMDSDINEKKLISYFENLGAKLSYRVNKETLSINIRSISDIGQIINLVNILNQALFTNKIDEVSFDLQKDKIMRSISESKKKVNSVLESSISEKLFYETSLAHQPFGTRDSVMRITENDIIMHRNRIFNFDNLEINIVGDISIGNSKRLISQITNKFSKNKIAALPQYQMNSIEHHTEFDSTQSHLAVIIPAISRTNPDYHNLLVANYLFGGSGFGSWLMEEIRQKRGLSYSVYSYLTTYQDSGYLRISLQTKNENIDLAKNIISEQIERFKNFEVDDSEINATKEAILRGFEMRTDTNRKILSLISSINHMNLDLDYFENYKKLLIQVNKENIKSALNRSMDFENISVFTVGKTIE